jgi:hypothetical protein
VLQRSPAIDGSPCLNSGDSVDRLAFDASALLAHVAMLAAVMAAICGLVLMVRRLAGSIDSSPGPETMLGVCGAGLLLVATGDLASRASAAPASASGTVPSRAWLTAGLTRLGLLLAVAAVSLPLRFGSVIDSLTAIAVVSVSLMATIQGPVAGLIGFRPPRKPTMAADHCLPLPSVGDQRAAGLSAPVSPLPAMPTSDLAAEAVGNLLQRFERLALPDGGECVRGSVCVVVAKGSRSGSAHVGFCPPLAAVPTIDVTTNYDGVEAVVSAAEVLPWGVRIECRLDEPAEETIEIPVDILATAPA